MEASGPERTSLPSAVLGLRGQLILALIAAFALSFALLGVATVQLLRHARHRDRATLLRSTANEVVHTFSVVAPVHHARLAAELGTRLVAQGTVSGFEFSGRGGVAYAKGRRDGMPAATATNALGDEVRVWLVPPSATDLGAIPRLLIWYVALTGGAILLLTYIALTHLIVRPVEDLTRASERLARRTEEVRVPVRGAREVARLAIAFNDMAGQLRVERAALEERLRQLQNTTDKLQSAQDQLVRSEKLASVGRLAAGVAHEIGNPLAAIIGFVELLQQAELPAKDRREFLARIHSETSRINRIIRDLLDFSRQGARSDAVPATNLEEIVEDAVRLVGPQKDLSGITIERRFHDATPPVRASPDQLTQVVLNLLLNAADAVAGEGTIEIELGPAAQPGFVTLVVRDSGPGIATEVQSTLFDPFVTTKSSGKGTGLGLAVCHTVVEQAGGTLAASNDPNGGARFEVTVPIASV